jgi:uncharacterized membrane protein YphA (DoxX/SURF4 family)
MHIFGKKGGGWMLLIVGLVVFLNSASASAHEAYVLTEEQIKTGMRAGGETAFASLYTPGNTKIAALAALGALIALAVYYLLFRLPVGQKINRWLTKAAAYDKTILRISLAVAILGSAFTASFLGPELPVSTLPAANLLAPTLFVTGLMLLFGLFTEVAAAILLMLYIAVFASKGPYLITYIEYFGLFILFLLFGADQFSLDHQFFKKVRHPKDHHDTEALITRISYALSLLYVAIGVKLLHPQVVVTIVEQYHLTKYRWLFPGDPLFIALGAGLSQIGLALSFAAGFAVRLSAVASFALIALSLLFFREHVWPHIPLLGMSLYLLLNNGGKFTLDQSAQHSSKGQ